jgi:hypothetical protein
LHKDSINSFNSESIKNIQMETPVLEKNKLAEKFRHIKGWGVDADTENDPTYPMKNVTGDDHKRLNYPKSRQQPVDVEVLHSNERPGVTAVFGTSTPPQGMSGSLRRYAFRHSESKWLHWLPLILADRINVFEGIAEDLREGRMPNVFAERGWKSELKHNKKGLATRILINVAVTTAVCAFVFRKRIWRNEEEEVMES